MPDSFQIVNPSVNPGLDAYMRERTVNGRQMRALKVKWDSAVMASEVEGVTRPATIINFNPVALRMEGGVDYKVPTFMDPAVPAQEIIEFVYQGKTYKATHLTLQKPKHYTRITDVYRKENEDMGDGAGVYDVNRHLPIEIAHSFWSLYNSEASSSCNMGGVIVFEGTKRDLVAKREDEPVYLETPMFKQLPDRTRAYYTVRKSLAELLALQLDKQRNYCDAAVNQGRMFWAEEAQKNNVVLPHRIWHQYQLDMGWTVTPEPWLMFTTPAATEHCKGCGAPKKRQLAYFCSECARPYNAFDAYMARELAISSAYIDLITDAEELEQIRQEEKKRRAARRRLLEDDEEEAKPKVKAKSKEEPTS